MTRPTQVSQLSLLIVDDEPILRGLIRRMVEQIGVRAVHEAADGEAALTLLGERLIHGIFCDIEMAPMNGLELLTRLRSGEGIGSGDTNISRLRPENIPVIMLTGHATEATLQQAVSAGVDGFVTKPVRPQIIRKSLDRIIDKLATDFTLGLKFKRFTRPEYVRFVLSGQMLPRSQPVIRELIQAIEEEDRPQVAIDLSQIDFLDEFGYGTLLMLHGITEIKGRRLAIIAERDAILRELMQVRIGQVIPVFSSQLQFARTVLSPDRVPAAVGA